MTPLVECLRSSGFRVWWDADIPGGSVWRPEILRHLEHARCVIVVWSEASVSTAAEFVHEEASHAKQRGVLLPVSIDAVLPPLGFGQIQSLNLIGWTGDPSDIRAGNVIAAARARVSGGPLPAPASIRGRAWRVAAVLAFALSTIGFLADIASLQSAVCAVPGIRSACALVGVGGVPTHAEEQQWATRPAGDCNWLRRYVSSNANGPYADQVTRLLQARRETVDESWRPEERKLRFHVSSHLDAFSGERAARADTLSRTLEEAAVACGMLGSDVYHVRSSSVIQDSIQFRCVRTSEGTRCSVDAQALCALDARHSITREVCE